MTAIAIKAFGGLKPIASALLLQPGEAQTANNARLVSGSLVPLNTTTALKALTKLQPPTIFRYGTSTSETDYWLEFASDTDVINSPIPNDVYGRLYWTDGGTPRYATNSQILSGSSYPGTSLVLGIPAPITAPIASGAAPTDVKDSETRAYCYTYVSSYGEEGPPSPPSSLITIKADATVAVNGLAVPPSGAYSISAKRIYRSSTVGNAAEYQFVAEIAGATTGYTDTKTQAALGEVIPSSDWTPPPAGLRGLKMMANGVAVAFKENTVYCSEPNLPHAWPNQYPVDYRIVGLSTFRQSVAVLTTGHPFLLSGTDPAAMSLERLEFPHACLSKQSIVDTGDGCLYAGADGVISIGTAGMKVVSDQLYSREQWQTLNPTSMRAFFHDSRYHLFYTTTSGTRGMLIFDFSGQGAILTTSDINASSVVSSGYSDPRTDTLYLAQGVNIVRFNASTTPLTATWRTGIYRLIRPVSFTCGLVRARTYPVTFRVYADNRPVLTRTVNNQEMFRLPSGFMASNWQFEIATNTEVTMFAVAQSANELQQLK